MPKKIYHHISRAACWDADKRQDGGESSAPFSVMQGCVFDPTLFSLMFSALLTDACNGMDTKFGIKRLFGGSAFNLRRLQSKIKFLLDNINDFLFANDAALNANSGANIHIQQSIDKFFDACDNCGVIISKKKIEVMNQPAPGKSYVEPNITINNQQLNAAEKNRITWWNSLQKRCYY